MPPLVSQIHPPQPHGYQRYIPPSVPQPTEGLQRPPPPSCENNKFRCQHDKKCHQLIVTNYSLAGLLGRFQTVSYDLPFAPGETDPLAFAQTQRGEAKLPPFRARLES